MQKRHLYQILKPALKIAFTLLALWLVYTKVDFAALRKLWAGAVAWPLIIALIAFIFSQFISSFRVLQFFHNVQIPIPVIENFKLYLLGMFYNLFLPGGIGGDGYKILVLKKRYNVTHKDVFTAVFFDRLSGLWALGFLLAILSFFLPQLKEYKLLTAAGFFTGTVIYFFVLKFFFKRVHQRFFITHALAIGVQGFQLICVAFILRALGHTDYYASYFFIFLLSSLSSLFPFSVGGLGAREVAIMWGAATLDLDKDVSVSVSLCFYFISLIMALCAVPLLFKKDQSATSSL
ncbi:MAG: lysylphosphatidylglycerol synthase transmembrane domain-containing protein [Niabella sp.]